MQNHDQIEIAMPENTAPRINSRRIELLDELRGLAVFCMIFYHGFFLLGDAFRFLPGEWLYEFFMPAEPFFAGLFIAISGISSRLSRSNAKRGLKLLAVAITLTAVTAFLLPRLGMEGMGIWFGILHLLSVCMLVYAGIRPALNRINPSWGVALCIVLYFVTANIGEGYFGFAPLLKLELPARLYTLPWLFPLGIHTSSFASADYFPVFPKIFIFLAGTFFGVYVKEGRVPEWAYKKRVPFFGWQGKHALLIYILHVPVIYAAAYIVEFIAKKI